LKRGDRDLALQLLKEKQGYEQTLQMTRVQLEQAIETSEAVKKAIKSEEERIRQKTAEALALKAQWKNAQIQIEMDKALQSIQGIEDTEQSFTRAQAKIKNATSEVQARAELAKGRVENRIRDLELAETDVAAANELEQLEAKLGIGSTPVAQQTTTKVEDSSVMSELEKLEAKIGGSSS
jgi:phage shock protein A